MKDIFKKINKSHTLGVATFLISLSFLFSRVLGLLRDRLLATNFGVGPATDAYTSAFRLPDLLFTLLVSGAFAVSFIPVFVGYLEKDKTDEAWEIANIVLNTISVLMIGLAVVSFIFTEPLVKMIVPGFDRERFELTVNLTRIMLVTPFLFGLSSVMAAIQQSFNRFTLFALSSAFYNVGIIIGILVFSKWTSLPIYGVAFGVVLGTLIQVMAQMIGMIGLGFRFKLSLRFWHPSVVRIVTLMIPRSLDLGIDQLTTIIETAIGSRLATGSLASYYYANNLKNVPIGLFGGAIATAIFPNLIRAAKSSDPSKLVRSIVNNLRIVSFLVIPSTVIAIIMRGYIVRLLFGFGDQATADTLGWLAPSIVAQSLFFVVARIFYALEDTKTPLLTSIASLLINIALSFVLSARYGVSGLAMALSITMVFELIVLTALLRRKIGDFGLRSIVVHGVKVGAASLAMGVAMYLMTYDVFPILKDDIGFVHVAPKFLAICTVGLIVFGILAHILRIGEIRLVLNWLRRNSRRLRFW